MLQVRSLVCLWIAVGRGLGFNYLRLTSPYYNRTKCSLLFFRSQVPGYPERNPVIMKGPQMNGNQRLKSRTGTSSLLQSVISRPGRLLEIPVSLPPPPPAGRMLSLLLFPTFWIVTEDSRRHYSFSLLKVAIKYTLSSCHLAIFLERCKWEKKLAIKRKRIHS